jgi:DNA repair exonuclease SbcCD ATPase subunit
MPGGAFGWPVVLIARVSEARHYILEGAAMQPGFSQEKANDLIREVHHLAQQVGQLEKRLDKQGNVLRAIFELMRVELHVEPAALAEKLANVVREKAERAQAPCPTCNRPLGDKRKCIYCGTERKAESIFDLL